MWTEYLKTNNIPKTIFLQPTILTDETDLTSDIKKTLSDIAQSYIDNRGLTWFKKDVIDELITGEKGLFWFRAKMSHLRPYLFR